MKAEKQEITGHDPGSANYSIYGGRKLCIYGSAREETGEGDSLKRSSSDKLKRLYLSKQSYNFSIFCQHGEIC